MSSDETKGKVLRFPSALARAEIAADPIETHHALVAIEPLASDSTHAQIQRPAAFLAQLIAAKAQLPQTRERRRAEPDVAVHAYQAVLTGTPYAGGRNFSRES